MSPDFPECKRMLDDMTALKPKTIPWCTEQILPDDDTLRKEIKLENLFKVFPKACVAVSRHIQMGADKYCDGEVIWDRNKSPDEMNSLLRHVMEFIRKPTITIAAAIAWRALALLEKTIEGEYNNGS